MIIDMISYKRLLEKQSISEDGQRLSNLRKSAFLKENNVPQSKIAKAL